MLKAETRIGELSYGNFSLLWRGLEKQLMCHPTSPRLARGRAPRRRSRGVDGSAQGERSLHTMAPHPGVGRCGGWRHRTCRGGPGCKGPSTGCPHRPLPGGDGVLRASCPDTSELPVTLRL